MPYDYNQSAKMRYCKDCRHFSGCRCYRPVGGNSPVTGQPISSRAIAADERGIGGGCGIQGIYFEKRSLPQDSTLKVVVAVVSVIVTLSAIWAGVVAQGISG